MPGDPLANHRASAGAALNSGDPDVIKRLYIQLGSDWVDAHPDDTDLESLPVLSAGETTPVVVGHLRKVAGLVLDAGCGPNPAVSLALAGGPAQVVSLDIGWGTVQVARQLARHRGLSLAGVVGDVERLPFRDGCFDGVSCVDCLEHLPDDAAGVRELGRVANAAGTIVLATPNRRNADVLRQRLRDVLRGNRKRREDYFVSNSHIREYTWAELERLIAPVLRLRRRAPVGWSRGWKTNLATRILNVWPVHQLSQMIVVVTEPR
jgi:SAM-dependent methyltransferase